MGFEMPAILDMIKDLKALEAFDKFNALYFKGFLLRAACAAAAMAVLASSITAVPAFRGVALAQETAKGKAARAKKKPAAEAAGKKKTEAAENKKKGAAAEDAAERPAGVEKAGKAPGKTSKDEARQKSVSGSAGEFIEKTLAGSGNSDILGAVRGAAAIVVEKFAPAPVRLSAYCTVSDGDSSEISYLYAKTYGVEASVKKDYLPKYNSADYFTFESDFLGLRGYQIVSKASAKTYIDMLCYQVGTDSVFVAYAIPAAKAAGGGARPKLMAEGGFLRSAVISAIEFENGEGFSFFETNLLKKFRPKSGGQICAQTSLNVSESPVLIVYSCRDARAASMAFEKFTLTRGGGAQFVGPGHKKDGEYNYYLSAAYILAVSNKLY